MATTRIELPFSLDTPMELLAFATLPDKPGCAVVIAKREGDDGDEWITWAIFASREEDDLWDNCQWGHYFDDAEYAWADFVERAAGRDIVRLRRPQ